MKFSCMSNLNVAGCTVGSIYALDHGQHLVASLLNVETATTLNSINRDVHLSDDAVNSVSRFMSLVFLFTSMRRI
jgi:hypothetical protein